MKRFWALAPWLVLLLGGAAVAVQYPGFPERWVSHWGVNGQPNGWSTKSWGSALMPLAIGAVVGSIFEAIAQASAFVRGPGVSEVWARKICECTQDCLRFLSLALTLLLSYMAVVLPSNPGELPFAHSMGWLLLPVVFYPMIRLMLMLGELRRTEGLPPGYSLWGYSNLDDPRIWVPKLSGLGMTLNFAHRASWVWLGALVGLPLLVLGATVLLSRS